MIQISPLWGRALVRVALLVFVLAAGLSWRPQAAWASHIRAGDIQVKSDTTAARNPRRVFFKMVLYLKNGQVDQEKVTIFFGDGTSSGENGVVRRMGDKRPIPGNTDTSVSIYYFDHIYPSAGSFTVHFIGENRNGGVRNMSRSEDQTFYINTRFTLDPALGINHSPVLLAPPVDQGAKDHVFLHNPAAYDADGDSLAFHLRPCQQVPVGVTGTLPPMGTNRPLPAVCTNYRYPNDPTVAANPVQVAYTRAPVGVPGAPAIFVQDVATGQITWNAPVAIGEYNVAMEVQEWRRTPLGWRRLGEVIRDMQITVIQIVNPPGTPDPGVTPPNLADASFPPDLCVIAGQRVTGTVAATSGASPVKTAVSLSAFAGIKPPATFVQTQTGPPQASGLFTWQTNCADVAQQPYQVLFKAQEAPSTPAGPTLIDERIWRITVVGPPPQNLQVTPLVGTGNAANRIQLNWNPYSCTNASRIHIYRKLNSSGFTPGPCQTGIPASTGYTRISSVAANVTTFIDSNVAPDGTVLGFDRGQTYCYRLYAEFPLPAGGASIASQEACVAFAGTTTRLVKVDVETTGTGNGKIDVCWTRPRLAEGAVFTGTPTYELSRGVGRNPGNFTLIATIPSLTDTCYTDTGINTQDLEYTYRVAFVQTFAASSGQAPIREVTLPASSVRTSAVPANGQATAVRVNWTHNVPWDNRPRPVSIYRRKGNAGPFVLLSNTAPTDATGGTYQDNDPALRRDSTYCYYVRTEGRYAGIPYLNSLLNRSQVQCMVLSVPPCVPQKFGLQPKINCEELAELPEFPKLNDRYTNRLDWTRRDSTDCDSRVANYRVYYRPTLTGPLKHIGTTTNTSYEHTSLEFSGGCYAVQAVGPTGLVSDTSQVVCQDNCVFFKLPNIFTPNGDDKNEVFKPKNSSPVRRIHFKAFNRWGVQVFENTTTADDAVLINWSGGGPVGESGSGLGAKVVDGIYYYLAEVEFADFANTKRTYKGWVEIVR